MFNGLIIKESLNDDSVLDYVTITKTEIWATPNKPKYWTAISFTSTNIDLPIKLSTSIKDKMDDGKAWYIDLKNDGIKYIIIKDNVYKYTLGDEESKNEVIRCCLSAGIPAHQLDWSE